VKLSSKFPAILLIFLVVLGILSTLLLIRHRREKALRESLSPVTQIRNCLTGRGEVFLSPELITFVPREMSSRIFSWPNEKNAYSTHEPSSFYRLNREHHFSAVLLTAHPSSIPLAKALLYSPIWVLSDVSPLGYLFRPFGASAWVPPEESTLLKQHPDPSLRAEWLIGMASSLILISRTDEAEKLLAMAESTHRNLSGVLGTRASLAASQGRWTDSLSLSRESLKEDHSNDASREILIRSLTECGYKEESLLEARKLVDSKCNEETLFLLARAANAANSKSEEIDALQRLVALSRINHQALGASLTYLGQAYAREGNRGEALRTLQQAMACPELTGEERHFIRGIMDHLMEGSTSSTTLPPLPSSGVSNPATLP
jgi:hypothetical protein